MILFAVIHKLAIVKVRFHESVLLGVLAVRIVGVIVHSQLVAGLFLFAQLVAGSMMGSVRIRARWVRFSNSDCLPIRRRINDQLWLLVVMLSVGIMSWLVMLMLLRM